MSASQIVHNRAGSPVMDGCVEAIGACWLCSAAMRRGAPIDHWQGSNFTDQNKARCASATHVCEGCVWACSWVQPPDRQPSVAGKKGLNLRLFSHLVDDRGYRSLNKADKPSIAKWLREPKFGTWFAAIADTGQKHVLPWTPLNACAHGGVVRFEERNVRLPSEDGWVTCDAMVSLLTLGVTKAEVQVGDYSVRSYQDNAAAVAGFEERFGQLRGSAWFDLALWLSQRDEEKYADRQQQARGAAQQNGKRGARVTSGVSGIRRKPAQTLEPATRQASDGGEDELECAGMGNEDDSKPESRRAEQISLFGDR